MPRPQHGLKLVTKIAAYPCHHDKDAVHIERRWAWQVDATSNNCGGDNTTKRGPVLARVGKVAEADALIGLAVVKAMRHSVLFQPTAHVTTADLFGSD